ncbi:MAG: response regulator [Magnetococcales bacterium]|nr:response regulator [Magnetococcales bacterium]
MKRRLNLLLLSMIMLTAATVGYGVWALARAEFSNQLERRIQQTHTELQNKFHSFDLFMQEIEQEMDRRLSQVMPIIADRILKRDPELEWTKQDLHTLAAEFKVRDIYLIGPDLVIFNTTFLPDMNLNLGNLSDNLKRRLNSLIGSGRVEVDRVSMSNQTGIIKKYAYHGPVGSDYLVEASLNMWEGADTFGSEAQKRFFLGEFFQSLVDSNDLLLELDLFIADDLAQWSLLREGVAMDKEIAQLLRQQKHHEIQTTNQRTVYNTLERRDTISGFSYYSKTVFDSRLPASVTRDMPLSILALALFASLMAYFLLERVIYRWLLTRVAMVDSGIQRMRDGNYAHPIAITGNDEISRIASAINTLSEKIQFRESELFQAKQELEQRVTERTEELQTSLKTLAASEADYRYLIEHARSIILRWNPNGTVTFFNEYAQEFFGFSEQDIIGRSLFETIVPKTEVNGRDLHSRLKEIGLNPNAFAYHENENQDRGGHRRWVAWANRGLWNKQGELTEILSIGTDITHLKRIQQELTLARDAAETANRAKSAFLAVMSHEIRTPMNAILGMAELLAETPLSDEQSRYVHIFRHAGDALLSLINDILDLSKIEADRLTLEQIELDLEEIVGDVADMMATRAREKGLVLISRFEPDLITERYGDPARIRQILVNLIGNAIKFTSIGKVSIWVGEPEPNRIRFEVEDTGIGIAKEKKEQVFHAFSQADDSVTRRFGGTGLGLTICKRLVEHMGGSIGVHSQPGRGSRFFFNIPLTVHDHITPKQTANLPAGLPLILAGDGTYFGVIRELLESAELAVQPIRSYENLTDYVMAEDAAKIVVIDSGDDSAEPGLSAADAIRHQLDPSQCGLVILIPEPDHTAFERAAECHALCLAKPVKRRALLNAIKVTWKMEITPPLITASAPTSTERHHAQRSLRLLLAEDSPDNTLLVRSYLKTEPYTLITVENGKTALEIAKKESFDLILMDVQMAEMDGLSATKAIRQWEQANNQSPTPIVSLTAHAMPEDTQKSLDAGCNGHLTKPIRKAELLKAILHYAR